MENTTVYSPMKSVFYQILRNALWQKGDIPQSINPEVFAEIWQMAKEQCVSGLIAEAMLRNNVKTNTEFTMDLLIEQQQHEKTYEIMQQTLSELTQVLNESDAEYVVFKGQTLAMLYPAPSMRTAGDIDFYVTEKGFSHTLQILNERLNIQLTDDDSEKHLNFYLNGIDCEMHHRLETFGSAKHQQYFDSQIDKDVAQAKLQTVGNAVVKTLSMEETILLVFKHLYNHLIIEGVGLRQVCDLAILLDKYHGKYDADLLKLHLKRIGYWKAFKSMTALLVCVLGLDTDKCPFKLEKCNYWWAKRLLHEIEKRGNFGRYNRKTSKPGVAKSLETARIAFGHFMKFLPLAPSETLHLIPQRIKITLDKYRK